MKILHFDWRLVSWLGGKQSGGLPNFVYGIQK